jgi:hypothetical protein
MMTYDQRQATYAVDPTAALPCTYADCDLTATHWVVSTPYAHAWSVLGEPPHERSGPPSFCLTHALDVQAKRNSKAIPPHDVPERFTPPTKPKRGRKASAGREGAQEET